MTEIILNRKDKYIRVHESGDFYSQEYLNKWIQIMKNCPDKSFLIYTQMYDLDYSNLPDNCILYWTEWYDSKNVPSKGLRAYVIDDGTCKIKDPVKTTRFNNAHFCTKGKNSKLKCEQCMYCYKGKGDVIFKLH